LLDVLLSENPWAAVPYYRPAQMSSCLQIKIEALAIDNLQPSNKLTIGVYLRCAVPKVRARDVLGNARSEYDYSPRTTRIKGRIAESLIEELLPSSGNNACFSRLRRRDEQPIADILP
jgi:hypothetical protein